MRRRALCAVAGQTSKADSARAALACCVSEVKKGDYEHYLVIRAAVPTRAQSALFTIRAFNLETADVKRTVSEGLIGQMRIQWWREAIDGIYAGRPPPAPVPLALEAVLRRHQLDRAWFGRVLDARDKDLDESEGPATLASAEEYGEQTAGSLVCLGLEALGGHGAASGAALRSASAVGRASALVSLLRGVPRDVLAGRQSLPRDLLERHSVRWFDLRIGLGDVSPRGEAGGGAANLHNMRLAAHEVARRAVGLLEEARKEKVPRELAPALMGAMALDRYLALLRHYDFDVFHPDLRNPTLSSPVGLQVRLWLSSWRGVF